jgi:hypothetical protein
MQRVEEFILVGGSHLLNGGFGVFDSVGSEELLLVGGGGRAIC